mmetsp:Transcript_74018/g.176185  ORF Transcript_74018/g.176185 Transcript_74018/m.176185 type:complete len:286 (-) Transcript_74018:72-929(-)
MAPLKVLVTGASGRTGMIVVRKLLEQSPKFAVRAMVRGEESEQKLRDSLGEAAASLEVVRGDATKEETLKPACTGMEAMVIASSAMPQIDKSSLVGVIAAKVFTFGTSSMRPSFWFEEGQGPEQVDYVGGTRQVDAAKAAGIKHVVLISSMMGTNPDHFLNTNMDNIVLWKRKAEKYLIASGVPYTIIHPGGLLPHPPSNAPAPGGKRELRVAVDDELGQTQVPREDVAQVCVDCLLEATAKGRSFDLGSGAEDEGEIYAGDLKKLLSSLNGKNCSYDAPKLPGE